MFRRQYGWVNSHTIRIDMFNNEYYKILVKAPIRYQDGECVAKDYYGEGKCEDYEPLTHQNFRAWKMAFGRGKLSMKQRLKWKSSWEHPGPFTFKASYVKYVIAEKCSNSTEYLSACKGDFA